MKKVIFISVVLLGINNTKGSNMSVPDFSYLFPSQCVAAGQAAKESAVKAEPRLEHFPGILQDLSNAAFNACLTDIGRQIADEKKANQMSKN